MSCAEMIDGRIWLQCFFHWVLSVARGVLSKRLLNVICFLYFSVLIYWVWPAFLLWQSSFCICNDFRKRIPVFFFLLLLLNIATKRLQLPNKPNVSNDYLNLINYWLLLQIHCSAQQCAAHIFGVSLCADACCSWGDTVEAILMQCSPLPESRRTSSFPCTVIAAGSGC